MIDNFNTDIHTNGDVRNILLELSNQLARGIRKQTLENPYGIVVLANSSLYKNTHRKVFFTKAGLNKFIDIYSRAVDIQKNLINYKQYLPFLHYGMLTNSSCGFYFDVDVKLKQTLNNEIRNEFENSLYNIGALYVKNYMLELSKHTSAKSFTANAYIYMRSSVIDDKHGLHIYVNDVQCSKENKKMIYDHFLTTGIDLNLKKYISEIEPFVSTVESSLLFDPQPFFSVNLLPYSTKNASSPIYNFKDHLIIKIVNEKCENINRGSIETSIKQTVIFNEPEIRIDELKIIEENIIDPNEFLYDKIINSERFEFERLKYLNMLLDRFPDEIFDEYAFKNKLISTLRNICIEFSDSQQIMKSFLNKFLARGEENIKKHQFEWEIYIERRSSKVSINYLDTLTTLVFYAEKECPKEFTNNILSELLKKTFLRNLIDETSVPSAATIYDILKYYIRDKIEAIEIGKDKLNIYRLNKNEYDPKKKIKKAYNRWILEDHYIKYIVNFYYLTIGKEFDSYLNMLQYQENELRKKIQNEKLLGKDVKDLESKFEALSGKKTITKTRITTLKTNNQMIKSGITLFTNEKLSKSKIKDNMDNGREYIGFLNEIVHFNGKTFEMLDLNVEHYVTRSANCCFIRIPFIKSDRDKWAELSPENKQLVDAYDWIEKIVYEIVNENGEWNKKMYEKQGGGVNLFEYVMYHLAKIFSPTIAEMCLILFGLGGDGKTTIFNLMEAVFGQTSKFGYVGTCPGNTFTVKSGHVSGHQEHLSNMIGARLIIAADAGKMDGGKMLNDGLTKQILSRQNVAFRGIFQGQVIIQYIADIMLSTNYQLGVGICDLGVERRVQQINMTNSFTRTGKADRSILERINNDPLVHMAFAAMLMNYYEQMIELYEDFSKVPIPLVVQESTLCLLEENDIGFGFIKRFIVKNPEASINLTTLEMKLNIFKASKEFNDSRSVSQIITTMVTLLKDLYKITQEKSDLIGIELVNFDTYI